MTMLDTRPGTSPDTDRIESAHDLLTEHLMCRRGILGHAWDRYSDPERPDSGGGRWFSVICTRCTTKRHYLMFGLARHSTVYEYPPGYKMSGDVTTEELWEEVLVREADGRLVVKARRIRGTKVKVPA